LFYPIALVIVRYPQTFKLLSQCLGGLHIAFTGKMGRIGVPYDLFRQGLRLGVPLCTYNTMAYFYNVLLVLTLLGQKIPCYVTTGFLMVLGSLYISQIV